MDRKKEVELIRKRNAELTQQLDDFKFKLEFDSQLNMEGYKRAKDLITDLEKIKKDWLDTLERLKEKEYEYDDLLAILKQSGTIMHEMGFKIPWHKRMFLRLKKWIKRLMKK